MSLFSRGTVLAQHKEPAFSRALVRFVRTQAPPLPSDAIPAGAPDSYTADELIQISRAAGIVDERDGKYLYRKLLRAKGRSVAVVADAVDDEPYVSSQIGVLLKLREQACSGLALCERVAESGQVLIIAYKNATDLETRIPGSIEGYPVIKLRGGYPAESRVESLDIGSGRKLIIGVGALIHFYRAVYQHIQQSTAFVTVAGGCVANPMNLEVSLGMTVSQVLERCGLIDEPTRIVCGGSMTGISIMRPDQTLVTHTTRAVLAFRESKRDALYSCIGCGRCLQVCPTHLNPMYIYRFVENSYFAHLHRFDAHLCTGCGTCSYICPSKLNVAGAVLKAREYALAHFITPTPEDEEEDLESANS